jgi:hypothetical protein
MTEFAAPETSRIGSAPAGPSRRADIRGTLASLFPASSVSPTSPTSPVSPPRATGRRVLNAVAQVMAVCLGAALLLERVPGLPSWDTIYGEDYWMFLTQALQQPWHVFITFSGYEQLLPRVFAQFAIYLPLAQASRVFAVCGALTAAGCGLFVFHASAGHIRSPLLRALLGTTVVLMPMTLMEIADDGTGAPWYLTLAMFWALLWRPRTRTGMAVAALVAFMAMASEVIIVLFLPLVAARLFVLRRPREQAVSAGWLAGCLVQLPAVLSSYFSGQSRLNRQPGTLAHSLAFYAHDIVLPALGWHLAWRLQALAGKNGATAIVAVILVAIVGAIFVTQRGNRPFVVTAVLTGFVFCVVSTTLTPNVATYPVVTPSLESGSRYSVLPIFLIEAVAIVGVDYLMRRPGGMHRRPETSQWTAIAASVLVVVLASGWVADFRYASFRSRASWNWGPIAATWQRDCEHSSSGEITVKAGATHQSLPCDRIRP